MNQNPLMTDEAIVAHLFYAAAEITVVSVQVGRAVISGALMIPEAEPRSIGFCPGENEEIPENLLKRGRLVRVRYASLVDEYAFQAAYLGRDELGWRLSVPHTVDRKDRRLLPRRSVLKSQRFTVQLDGAGGGTRRLLVVDLSPAGFSVLVDPRLDKLAIGEIRKAKLFLPDRPALVSRCTVVNVRHVEGNNAIDIVGCCFVGLGFSNCGLLADLLKTWR